MSAKVQGVCPKCGLSSLFLGDGGYVTCGNLPCKDPGLASDLLFFGPQLHELARAGAQVHHIQQVRRELHSLIGDEPLAEKFAGFIDRLVKGRDL